jgi:hypothetical protein
LQSSIWSEDILKLLQKMHSSSSSRAVGLKTISSLMNIAKDSKQPIILAQTVLWMSSALRRGENRLSHYLDNTTGQGQYFEESARKLFFEIINALAVSLKTCKSQEALDIIIDSLKWNYKARDHRDLA